MRGSNSEALAFREVFVERKDKLWFFGRSSPKVLLVNASGAFLKGELTFIMGPSGSGKTTLLEALLSLSSHTIKGQICLGGAKKVKFVPFGLEFVSVLTVRQTLVFAAQMYGHDGSVEERVQNVIELFLLSRIENCLVGDGKFIRGLSGGEKRRLGVAIEFLSEPDILVLDESTTGLDSASALILVQTLSHACKSRGLAVIMTIHQPSELLFSFADSLVLLSAGKVEFCGPRARVVQHFMQQGHSLPQKTNVADWALQILSIISVDEKDGHVAKVDELVGLSWEDLSHVDLLPAVLSFRPVFCFRLFYRQMNVAVRDPRIWLLRILVWLLFVTLSSTIWINLGSSSSAIQKSVSGLMGILGFCSLVSIAAIPYRHVELETFRKERKNGMYSAIEFSIVCLVSDVLILFFWSLVAALVTFFTVGYVSSPYGASRFFMFATNLFLVLLVFESIMCVLASTVRNTVAALGIAVVLYGIFISLCGFFVSISKVGWWYRWMIYFDPLYYGFSANVLNNFYDTFWDPYCSPTGFPCFPFGVNGTSVLSQRYLSLDLWQSSVILVAMSLVLRCLHFLSIEFLT